MKRLKIASLLFLKLLAIYLLCVPKLSTAASQDQEQLLKSIGQNAVEIPKTAITQNYLLEQLQQATQQENTAIAQLLLTKGADPGRSGAIDSHSALTIALSMNQMPLAYSMLPYLRKETFNTQQRALFYAVRRGDLKLVDTLLVFNNGQNLTAHTEATRCEIKEAIRFGHQAIVERLYKLRPECQDQLLLSSIEANQPKIFTWLVSQANNEQLATLKTDYAMQAAIRVGNLEMIQALERLKNSYVSAADAVNAKQLAVLKYYQKTGKVKLKADAYSLMQLAAQQDAVDILAYFASIGMQPDPNQSTTENCTPSTHTAVSNSAFKALTWLLDQHASIENSCNHNMLLHAAINGNDTQMLAWLLNNEALKLAINAPNDEGETALHLAVRWQNLSALDLLLKHQAQRNLRNKQGNTPLHEASQSADTPSTRAMLERLLEGSAAETGLDIKNNQGDTPFLISLASPNAINLRLFLEARAKVQLSNNLGLTALHQLAASSSAIPDSVNLLVEQGAALNQQDYAGKTPLYYAVESYPTGAIQDAQTETVLDQLIALHADLNQADKAGITPLLLAIKLGKIELAKRLITSGADPKAADQAGNTSLHYAASLANGQELIKLLHAKGVDLNALNAEGNSAIFLSTNTDTLQTFKDLGAKVNLVNKQNESLIAVFASREDKNTSLALIQRAREFGVDLNQLDQYQQNALHRSIRFNAPTLSASLVQAKINLNQADQEGNTPLMLAVRSRSLYHVKLLLDHSADVNLANRFGKTALQQAIELGEDELAHLLLAAQANINTKDTDQRSPLLTALANNRTALAAKLIALGEDVNIRSKGEWTALHYAAQLGNLDLVKVLLEKGTINGVKNWGNETAADLAQQNPTILAILQAAPYQASYFQQTDTFANTPLHWGVRDQNLAAVDALLASSKAINAHNIYDETSLILALKGIQHQPELATQITERLLAAGAEVNTPDRYGNTALYYALQNRTPLPLLEMLLAKQADWKLKNKYGDSLARFLPLQSLAVLKRLYSLEPACFSANEDSTTLWNWVVTHPEREPLTAWLLAQGISPNLTTKQQPSLPMVLAIQAHAYELLEPLRNAGGRLQLKDNDLSALDGLIQQGDLDASIELLNQPDYQTDFTQTDELSQAWLLTLTQYDGNASTSLVKALFARGLKPSDPEQQLMTTAIQQDADLLLRLYQQAGLNLKGMMIQAAHYNSLRSLDYLKEAQISVNETLEQDGQTQTPLSTALNNRNLEALSWLVQHGANTEQVIIPSATASQLNEPKPSETEFLKQVKTLIPTAKPSYALVEALFTTHDYEAATTLFDNWPNTLELIRADKPLEPVQEEGVASPKLTLSELLIYHYGNDPQQLGLALLKRLVAAGEGFTTLENPETAPQVNLAAKVAYPELFRTLYDLGYRYQQPELSNQLIEQVFISTDPAAFTTFQLLLQQPDTTLDPHIFNSLSTSNLSDKSTLLSQHLNEIYAALTHYFHPNDYAPKLAEQYLQTMLNNNEFCEQHKEIVQQQIALTEFTPAFFKDETETASRTLPCLNQAELLTALVQQSEFTKQLLQAQGLFVIAQNYASLAQLKSGVTTLLSLGIKLNQSAANGDTLASIWLAKGLKPSSEEQALSLDAILDGLSYLQAQGLDLTLGRNLSHELVNTELSAEQTPSILQLMDGILQLAPQLASLSNQSGQQTLHVIASNKTLGFDWQRRLIQRTLKEQAALNAQDQAGNTPLLVALQAGNIALADWLIKQGADIQISNHAGQTALHLALDQFTKATDSAELMQSLLILVERLMKKGATIQSSDQAGNSPLHQLALQSCKTKPACQVQLQFAQALLAAKAEVNSRNADGDTPLLLTAYSGNLDLAKFLLEHQAEVNATDQVGNQALSLALDHKHYGLADRLVAQNADIQQANWADLNALKRVEQSQELGLANVISRYHPTVRWNPTWQAAAPQAGYFYDLLSAKRLLAVAASPRFEQAELYNEPSTNKTLLHIAAAANATEFMAQLLKLKHPIDVLNNESETPLQLAIQAQAKPAISALIAAGANPELVNTAGQNALILAVLSNDLATLKTLVESMQQAGQTLDFNQQDSQGLSLLHYAVKQQNLALLEYLLKAGANPELADQAQRTALFYALEQNDLAPVKMLVEHQASLSAKDQAQRTPLLYAVGYYVQEANDTFKQHLAERITLIDYLLAQGAELQAVDENTNTALHLAMPIYELGQHLIEQGADIHALNQEGETAIFQVIAASYPERQITAYLQTLLDKGLDINARNKYNETLLSKAVRHDKIQVMTYLLEHSADPTVSKDTSPEQAGFTLPMYIVNRAASNTAQKIQLLSLLKDKGADFNALNTRGENLLFLAVQNSEPSYDLLNWLLAQGVSAQVLNQQGQSLLHLLVTSTLSFVGSEPEQATVRQQLVNRLIQQGLNINARDMNGRSVLIYALQQQRNEWITPLLNAGINPNLQDNTENSALALAIERFSADANKDLSLIKQLLVKGADPNQRNSLGETSLFLAYRANNTELIELLLTHGANPQLRSYYGKIAGQI